MIQANPELCFIDADHRSEAVSFCIETLVKHAPNLKCIIIHDIYWSPDMLNYWKTIVADHRFVLTVDLFQAGLIFLDIDTPKQHFSVRF